MSKIYEVVVTASGANKLYIGAESAEEAVGIAEKLYCTEKEIELKNQLFCYSHSFFRTLSSYVKLIRSACCYYHFINLTHSFYSSNFNIVLCLFQYRTLKTSFAFYFSILKSSFFNIDAVSPRKSHAILSLFLTVLSDLLN